ncbi:DnaJ-domain-containing protein [Tilletiaria anomala UBC 951]|uniref:Diphthamide biosynthesis protein 4 n=1 Tax=Tilletiaria anomala (strain ATCC 24038 / CBS 436.72 / UBC 951) TaxID=1037660 RepID=A0A066V4Q7_TILAU|nr:DnaJ-domain-containing protein [Tilletiaria anomala UBC 951]KDN36416.1 DnaJ-domain-containing protein [Tilletiaria anomala UBC 951]
MKDDLSLYSILGVRQDASLKEIRASYFVQVRQHHPDKLAAVHDATISTTRGSSESDERIRVLNHAYEVLSNVQLRAAYDASVRQARENQAAEATTSKIRIAGEIDIELFEVLLPEGRPMDQQEAADDQSERCDASFSHPCRCGGNFVVSWQQLESGLDTIACQGCSEAIRIKF